MSLRVCLDAHMVGSRETGNETYIVNLLRAFERLGYDDVTACLTPDSHLPDDLGSPKHLRIIYLNSANNWARLLLGLPRVCRQIKADVLHVTYNAPLVSPCRTVVTVHDVSFRLFPKFFSLRDRLLFVTVFRWSLHKASAVITVSYAARNDILRFYPFLSGKVFVTYEAASDYFAPVCENDKVEVVLSQYGICRPFILAVGNLQPRKNLGRLIEAYRLLSRVMENPPALVLVGKPGYGYSNLIAQCNDLRSSGQLIMTGYVPLDDLRVLYSAASLFVYPSLYEGFGLPVLEAMACGTPVVTSNISALPEIADDAAILVDPTDVRDIARAMEAVLSNEALAKELSKRGLRRAREFSWERTARETREIYELVANTGKL